MLHGEADVHPGLVRGYRWRGGAKGHAVVTLGPYALGTFGMESRRRMEGSGIDFWYGVLRSDGGQGARDFWNGV